MDNLVINLRFFVIAVRANQANMKTKMNKSSNLIIMLRCFETAPNIISGDKSIEMISTIIACSVYRNEKRKITSAPTIISGMSGVIEMVLPINRHKKTMPKMRAVDIIIGWSTVRMEICWCLSIQRLVFAWLVLLELLFPFIHQAFFTLLRLLTIITITKCWITDLGFGLNII